MADSEELFYLKGINNIIALTVNMFIITLDDEIELPSENGDMHDKDMFEVKNVNRKKYGLH